jgi:hypothetical protein
MNDPVTLGAVMPVRADGVESNAAMAARPTALAMTGLLCRTFWAMVNAPLRLVIPIIEDRGRPRLDRDLVVESHHCGRNGPLPIEPQAESFCHPDALMASAGRT